MFSKNGNIFKPDIICSAEIRKKVSNPFFSFSEYSIVFDTKIFYDDVKLRFNNPEIHYKDYDIMAVGVFANTSELHTGFDILINQGDSTFEDCDFTAYVKKENGKIDIYLEDVQQR